MSQLLGKLFAEFIEREERGVKKYGTTMDRNDLSLDEWIQHLKEELMDAICYLSKIEETIKSQTIYDAQRHSDYQKADSRNDEGINTRRETEHPRTSL
jgi:hypothetical protein